MAFEFATPGQIVFGTGTWRQLPERVRGWGRRALLVTSPSAPRREATASVLTAAGHSVEILMVQGEPSIHFVNTAASRARETAIEYVIGLGGGSVIDAAKAIAGLATNPGDILDYLEVVGRGIPLSRPALPWIAVPTTAGTGAEATRNAVLSVPEKKVKVSLRSPALLARIALVDPELTLDLPAALTATTGLDALTQLIEAYVSVRANPFTDSLCARAIPEMAKALPRAYAHPRDLEARTTVSYASLCSGIALANAGLGAVHGFAGPIGGRYDAPHGAICAALLAPVFGINARALAQRLPSSPALAKFRDVATWLTGSPTAETADAISGLDQLVSSFQIQPLKAFGIKPEHFAEIVAQARQASSMKGNPLPLENAELEAALSAATGL